MKIGINTILHTKDGSRIGNAIVIDCHKDKPLFTVKTDYGNEIKMYPEEISEMFTVGYLDMDEVSLEQIIGNHKHYVAPFKEESKVLTEMERLYEWLMTGNREPAQTKFTAGTLRNVAKEIEFRTSKRVFVIQESEFIIGVANNMGDVKLMMNEYYGGYTEIKHKDVQESGIECIKRISAIGDGDEEYTVTVHYFELNKI